MNKKEKDRQSLNKNRKVLSAKAQDEEMCGIITKTTMGVVFFVQFFLSLAPPALLPSAILFLGPLS